MLRFFRDTDQLAIFLVSILTLIFWYLDLQNQPSIQSISNENIGPLGEFLRNSLKNTPFVYASICYVLLLSIAFFLVRINTKFILTFRRTQLPALFFILTVSGFTNITTILLPLAASLLFCVSLERMFVSYKKPRLAYNFFDAAFLITLGSLLYAPAILFNLIVFYSLMQLRVVSWREWMLAILGIAAPLFIYHSIVFVVTGTTNLSVISKLNFFPGLFFPWNSLPSYFFLSMLGLLLIVASIDIASGFQLKKIIARKVYLIFFSVFFVSAFLFFIIKNVELGVLAFTSISLGFLFTHYFSLIRFNWFREIMFDLLILLVLAKKLIPVLV